MVTVIKNDIFTGHILSIAADDRYNPDTHSMEMDSLEQALAFVRADSAVSFNVEYLLYDTNKNVIKTLYSPTREREWLLPKKKWWQFWK